MTEWGTMTSRVKGMMTFNGLTHTRLGRGWGSRVTGMLTFNVFLTGLGGEGGLRDVDI